jgi:hypothetical protein
MPSYSSSFSILPPVLKIPYIVLPGFSKTNNCPAAKTGLCVYPN